ncbi:alpha/beta-hydrolase [Tilletiaria anomala UBC 951]|uniref:Alpha/beta-hydrolase n=1 Tax=Tilletiaria anomala (strain ATCC 24038 / CBS 436.72 / UBC 951) TaxID=1037660 RepID=A0A066VKI5_TILAU|nr:alpha/beta-hydrolase [Tilletiaria anomala UBC 951]KDN39090.1 alpha/beta-hydrolase [Tilletiaria anomala UBC 951]
MSSSLYTTEAALADPVPTVASILPFKVSFPDSELQDLVSRLKNPRYAQEQLLPQDPRSAQLTPTPAWIQNVVENFWLNENEFTLKGMIDEMNKYPHFVAEVDWCKQLHFVYVRSSRKDAIPLLLLHGWPGAFHEFYPSVDGLVEPENPDDPAFHVVIPSLPGFLFSSPPPTGARMIGDVHGYARIINALMIALGYGGSASSAESIAKSGSPWKGYGVQGGDWGSAVSRAIANVNGSRARAVHLNFCPARPSGLIGGTAYNAYLSIPMGMKKWLANFLGEEARKSIAKTESFQASMAYYHVQHWRPAQLLTALTDSPLGMLGWIGAFLQDPLPPLTPGESKTLTVKALLTNVSMFWLTRSIGTSFLLYTVNAFLPDIVMDPQQFIRVPFGFTEFPRELASTPALWVAGTGNLVWAAKASKGGHFAALEVPEVYVEHMRNAFAKQGHARRTKGEGEGGIVKMDVAKAGLWDREYRDIGEKLS